MAKHVDDKENIYAEESYRTIATILNSLDALVYVADMQTYELLFVNEYGKSIWGDIQGKTCWKALQTNQDGPCSFCTNDYLLDEFGVPAGVHVWEFQNTVNQRWYHCRDQAIRWADGRCVRLEIASDITERKQAEEDAQHYLRDMAHVMRLSTMGEMASGLAHELNQPLTALISYCGTAATLVKDLPTPPQQLGEILERAEEQAHRASQIIHHLRAFLRKSDGHKEPLDLDRVIVGMIDFMKPELKNGHAKIEHLPGALGSKVMADKVQIEQVLINLLLNSLEAIDGTDGKAGNIIVQTRLLPNETIETTVADDGPGIDAGIADRMFDPFQTSKSSGMGMGLSISRSIIEEHEGKLWAEVRPEDGALFGFNLPVCK
jgi:C4-dicarboxylate-specific signal transduction histidine kinase